MSALAKILLAAGVLVLLFGVAMPATQTQQASTCYEDPAGYGQDCVRATYEAPNAAQGPVIGLGVFLLVVGVIASVAGGDASSGAETGTGSHELAAEIEKRRGGGSGPANAESAPSDRRTERSAGGESTGGESSGGESRGESWNWERED